MDDKTWVVLFFCKCGCCDTKMNYWLGPEGFVDSRVDAQNFESILDAMVAIEVHFAGIPMPIYQVRIVSSGWSNYDDE